MDTESVKNITEIANDKMKQDFPLLDRHYLESDIKYILEATYKWYELNRIAREAK